MRLRIDQGILNFADFFVQTPECLSPPSTWASMTSTAQEPQGGLPSIRTLGTRRGTERGTWRDCHPGRSLTTCQDCRGNISQQFLIGDIIGKKKMCFDKSSISNKIWTQIRAYFVTVTHQNESILLYLVLVAISSSTLTGTP